MKQDVREKRINRDKEELHLINNPSIRYKHCELECTLHSFEICKLKSDNLGEINIYNYTRFKLLFSSDSASKKIIVGI